MVWACLALGFCAAIFCARLWQPERQVRLHQKHLFQALEKRDWKALGNFIDANYADRWQHDKKFLLTEPVPVFAQFFALTVEWKEDSLVRDSPQAWTLTGPVRFSGTGSAIAALVIEHVNALHEPFSFRWQKVPGWKPWAWQLVDFDQPQLTIPED